MTHSFSLRNKNKKPKPLRACNTNYAIKTNSNSYYLEEMAKEVAVKRSKVPASATADRRIQTFIEVSNKLNFKFIQNSIKKYQ